ncbi:type III pantothenate kinase [Candidatus Sumerlaeota bacterium]|nr:type III pantothenate kinase [Candidatus Sumerlaeota bacterium]
MSLGSARLPRHLLTIDIGNTNVVLGVFERERLLNTWRLSTGARRTTDEVKLYTHPLLQMEGIDRDTIQGIALSSVVPKLTGLYVDALEELLGQRALVVDHTTRTDLKIEYLNPAEVGSDRLANAVGARKVFGKPVIAVDFGTAITLDILTEDDRYLGGAILPGPLMAAEALYRGTAKLPQISLEKPEACIGRSTEMGIRSGLYFGFAGAIDLLIEKTREETGIPFRAVATGGLGRLISEQCRQIEDYHPHLTLLGLREIWLMSQEKRP